MNSSKTLPFLILCALALIWGSSFILIKRGLVALSPVQVAAVRIVVACVCLLPFAWFSLREVERRHWRYIVLAGLMGSGIPAVLFSTAQTHLNSATASLLNALSPLFTLIVGMALFQAKPAARQIAGVGLGFCGAVLLVIAAQSEQVASQQAASTGFNWYSLFAVGATVCYGFSVNINKHYLHELKPMQINSLSMLAIALPYACYLILSDFPVLLQQKEGIWQSIGFVAILAVLSTALSNTLFFRLIQISSPIFASSVTYLIPIVALMWGILDGERFSTLHIAGIGVILTAIYLVNKK